jgi:flagella basal body P-ring formation protein FlgA
MVINLIKRSFFKFLIIFFLSSGYANGSTINGTELKKIIETWLEDNGKKANISILDELKYPECNSSKLIINDISGDYKLIKVNCVDKNPWQFIVRNKVNRKKIKRSKETVNVFALKNSKDKGAIISEKDLVIVKKKSRNTNLFITNKEEVIGKKLRNNVRSNKALKHSNLGNDWLIEKNSMIMIVNDKASITIKEQGIAMENANYMEKIRVKNVKSGKILVGYAKNEKKVIINAKQN